MLKNPSVDHPLILTTAVLASAIAVLVFNIEPVYLGVLHDQLGLNPTQMGTLAGVEIGGIGLASVAAVFWIRRISWRLAMAIGLAVVLLGNALAMRTGDYDSLLVIRGLVGFFGEGTVFAVVNALFGDTKVPSRAFALSMVGQVGLGMVGLLVFPGIAEVWGAPGVFLGMAAPAVFLILLLPYFPTRGRDRDPAVARSSEQSNVRIFLGLGVICLWFVGLSSMWAFMERMGVELGLPQESVGTLLAAGLGLGAAASFAVSVVGDRFGTLWPPAFSVLMHLGLSLLILFWAGKNVYIFVVLSFTVIWNIGLPYLLGNIAAVDSQGRFLVLLIAAQALGNTLGPIMGGHIVAATDYFHVAYNCAAFCFLAILLYAFFVLKMRQRESAEHKWPSA